MPTAKQGRARTPAASRKALREKGYGSSPEPTTVRQHIDRVHPNPTQGASIQSPKVYRAKVRKVRTPGQSYKAASSSLKGIQQLERQANVRVRTAREAAQHHDSGGGLLSDVGHALSGTASSAAHSATDVGKALAGTQPTGLKQAESNIGKIASIKVPGTEYALKGAAVLASGGNLEAAKHVPKVGRSNVGEVAISAVPVAGEEAGGARLLSRGVRAAERGVGRAAAKKEAATTVVKDTASQATKKTAAKVAEKAPAPVKTAGRATAKAAKSKPVTTTAKVVRTGAKPVTVPLKAVGKHPVYSTGGLGAAAATSGAIQGHGVKGAEAPFVGTAKALTHPDTYITTAKGAPSLVTAPVGIAGNLGLTAYRAGVHAIPGKAPGFLPGKREYSGKEIAAPTAKSASELADYAKGLAKTYGSGDAKKIEEATRHDYGLWPAFTAGFPTVKGVRELGRITHATEAAGHVIPEGVKQVGRDHAMRRREAQAEARKQTQISRMERAAEHDTRKHLERVPGSKRATHNRNVHVEPADTARMMVAEGIPLHDRKAAMNALHELRDNHYKNRPADAKPEHITSHDVVNYLIDNYDRLAGNKHYRRGIESAREHAQFTDTHLRAQHFNQAKTHGRKLPEEYFPHEQVRLDMAKRANKLRIDGWKPAQIAKKLEKENEGQKVNAQNVKDWLDEPGNVRVKRAEELQGRQAQAFAKDMAQLRQEKGLEVPHYTRAVDYHGNENPLPIANLPHGEQTAFATHHLEGKIRKKGTQDESFKTYTALSVRRPRRIRVIHGDTKRFYRENVTPVQVVNNEGKLVTRRSVTSREAEHIYDDPNSGITPQTHMLVDTAKVNRALRDAHATPEQLHRELMGALDEEALKSELDNAKREGRKGKKYVMMPRAAVEEFLRQREPRRLGAVKKGWRWPMHAILAYSPKWLLSQPIAEGAVSAASVNPLSQVRGVKGAGKASQATRDEIAARASSTAGTGWRQEIQPLTGRTDERGLPQGAGTVHRAWHSFVEQLHRSRTGRGVSDVVSGAGSRKVDMWKGGKIREGVAYGHLHRHLQGPAKRLGRAMGIVEKLDSELQGKPFHEQLDILAKRPEEMAKLEAYVNRTNGDWSSIIRSGKMNESALSQALIFYPFLRYATTWYLRYGKQHPFKAGGLAALANANQQALEKLYGGDPSFFTGWANAPLYGGLEGKKKLPNGKVAVTHLGDPTKVLPFSFGSPGANPLIETVGNTSNPIGAGLSIANPWVAATYAAISGRDPQSGWAKNQKPPSPKEVIGSLTAQAAAWPGVLRFADTATRRVVTRALRGADPSATQMRYDAMSGLATNPLKTAVRGFIPGLPLSSSNQRQQADTSRLLSRKYAIKGDFNDFKQAMEDAMKHGDQHQVIENARTALRAVYANKMLNKEDVSLGLPTVRKLKNGRYVPVKSLKSREYAGIAAQSGEQQFTLTREQILDYLDKAKIAYPNVPPFRGRKVRPSG